MASIYCVLDPFSSQQAKDKENHEQCDRQEEQDLGNSYKGARGAAKAKNGQHGGDDERDDSELDHPTVLLLISAMYLERLIRPPVPPVLEPMMGMLESDYGIEKYFSYVVIKSPFIKHHYPIQHLFGEHK
jgi:hypothetical protein